MRGPLILVATLVVGGVLLAGLSRSGGTGVADSSQVEPRPRAEPVAVDPGRSVMTVYKTPTCGCCTLWIDHLQAAGFPVEAVDVDDLTAIKVALGVPLSLGSCHTAEIDGVVVEGHVPARDLADFLAERPAGVRGLAVPGMPIGSPGMEVPGQAPDPYDVIAFSDDGSRAVFRSHRER